MRGARKMVAAIGLMLLGAGLVPRAMADDGSWGLRQDNPVEVCKPPGQRAWLQQLRCTDGSELSWRRIGSIGTRTPMPPDFPITTLEKYMSVEPLPLADGEVDYHMVDGYQVDCGGVAQVLYLDMYHCDVPVPQRAPAGLLFDSGS